MDLIAYAVPFFLLALLVELAVDRLRGTGYFRLNDAVNSLSAGILSTTFGYATKLLPLIAWGFVLENFALLDMPLTWFELSTSGIALWIVAALAWDFCYYWFHRFSHEISILWAAHAVHHQSEDYNLSTALRQTSTGFLFGWIFYLPLFLIGFPLEVLVTVNAINLIYQFWVHTRHIDRLGVLDRILVTPSNHRVHHAQNDRYIDRNYGGMLIVWDRLFGTFEDEDPAVPVVYGVRRPLRSWDPFWANLQVYAYLYDDARRTRRWRDKLGLWFARTGWRPADVAASHPVELTDPARLRRFDPALPAGTRRYILLQFAVATAATLGIGIAFGNFGLQSVLVPCLLLWMLLFTLGRLSEGRAGARRLEWLRLAVVVPLGAGAISLSLPAALQGGWWIGVATYVVSSALLLLGLVPNKIDKKQNLDDQTWSKV